VSRNSIFGLTGALALVLSALLGWMVGHAGGAGDARSETVEPGLTNTVSQSPATQLPNPSPGAPAARSDRTKPFAAAGGEQSLEHMSISELVAVLDPLARSGDAAAACRLAAEMIECRLLPMLRGVVRYQTVPPPNLDEKQVEAWVDRQAAVHERMDRSLSRCAEADEAQLQRAPHYLVMAARAGHLPSVLNFAHMPVMFAADFIRDPSLAPIYREHAWPLLRAAIAAGDRDSGLALARSVSMPQFDALPAVLPPRYRDRAAARAFEYLLLDPESRARREADRTWEPFEPAALAKAERWFHELYGGQELRSSRTSRRTEFAYLPQHEQMRCDDPEALMPR
jgi:hypothetical protein